MSGSDGSGEDIESGRTNFAESTTIMQGGRPSELDVPFNGLAVFEAGPRRDDQRPDRTLSGVLGRGWNGADTSDHREPGAGVVGIGAPNRGPGMVGVGGGARVPSPVLGSADDLGESGLGGTGVIGLGGPGDSTPPAASPDIAIEVPSRPGVGIVGQGGASLFPTPVAGSPDPGIGNGAGVVGIAGGRPGPPFANLDQLVGLALTANLGVVGFGGDGPNALSPGGPLVGPVNPGAGVCGVGGVAKVPGTPTTVAGPGVVGIAGGGLPKPTDSTVAEVGVAGFGNHGSGVLGISSDQPGVQGSSTGGAGVAGGSSSGVGVAGSSDRSNGGYFSSQAVAQIHLEPQRKPLADPNGTMEGRAGDLLVLLTPKEEQIATLWFCRTKGDASSAVWVRIA